MLYLEINGHKAPRRRCKDAVEWFVRNHMPRYKLDITVHHRGLLREGVYGYCDVVGKTYNPREFLIEIHNRLDYDDYIEVLMHEIWHVYQFVKGDLKIKCCKRYYKGICIENFEYEDQEHEKDACKMEKILYKKYLNYINK